MHCAIIVSGYTRSFSETHANLSNFIKSNKNIEFDLFFSVNMEDKEIGKHKGHKNTYIENKKILESFEPKILHFNDYYENDKKNEHTQYSNLLYLYNLFIDYSSNLNYDYDFIIRTRYDNLILNFPDISSLSLDNNLITVPRGFFYGMTSDFSELWDKNFLWKNPEKFRIIDEEIKYNFIINDRFAIGTPKAMSHYFLFGHSENKIHMFTENKFNIKSTEGAMAFNLKRNGIKVRWDESLVTQIVR